VAGAAMLCAPGANTAAHRGKPPPAGVFALADSPLTLKLVASRTYFPTRRYDARTHLERAFRFTLPAEIAVVDGNAGNHLARLSFRFSTGKPMTCLYRGGADRSHPKDPEQIAKGLRYRFKHCTAGLAKGEEVVADALAMSVLNGDKRAGPTTIELVLTDISVPAPPPASELAQSGLDKARAGDYAGAIADYDAAIQANPSDAYAYSYRAAARSALGDSAGAASDIQRGLLLQLGTWTEAIARDPGNPDLYADRAITLLSLDRAQGAVDDLTTSLALRPNHARTRFELGNARSRAGDLTGARAEYDAALTLDPNLAEAYFARAEVRLALGDQAGADEDRLAARLVSTGDQVSQ